MKTASVSVIIPTYNRPAYLEQAVSSVLAQTVHPCEILIIDDGSAVEHRLEIDRIGVRHPMIHLHRFSINRGRSAARNMGIAVARGEFLVFLDDDDLLHPRYLESSLEYFKKGPAAEAVFCRGKSFGKKRPWNPLRLGVLIFECGGPDSKHLRLFLPRSILDMTDLYSNPVTAIMLSPCPINSVLIRKDALKGVTFPPDLSLGEDTYFLLALAAQGCRFRRNPEILAFIRRHPQNTGNNGNKKELIDYIQFTRRLFTDNLLPGTRNQFLGYFSIFLKRVKKGDLAAAKDFAGLLRFPGLFWKFSYLYLVALFVRSYYCLARLNSNDTPAFPGLNDNLAGR